MALSVAGTFTGAGSSSATVRNVNAAVGTMLVVLVACDNSGSGGAAPTVTVTDDSGNTYTQRGTTGNRSSGASNDGASQLMFTAPVTVALTTDDISVAVSPTSTDTAVVVYVVAAGAGESISFIEAGTPVTGLVTSHACTSAINIASGRMFIGHAAIETGGQVDATGDTDTVNGSWSTAAIAERANLFESDATCITSIAQYKVVNATGAQTWSAATSFSKDSAANYMILAAVSAFTADAGGFTVSGTAAALSPTLKRVTAEAAAYTLSGADAGLLEVRKTAADGGSFVLTGEAATVERAYPLTAVAASYTISAATTELLREASGRVPAAEGAFVVSGVSASLLEGRAAEADVAFYFLTGADASFGLVREIVPVAGSFSVSGGAADLKRGLLAGADAGAFTLSGAGVTFNLLGSITIVAEAVSYAISGAAATLVAPSPPAPEVSAIPTPSYAYWAKRRRERPRAPKIAAPMPVEVRIDPAVLEQIEAERRAAELKRKTTEALERVSAVRQQFPPRKRVLR